MSYHLLGDFLTANSVLDTFRQSQTLNVRNKNLTQTMCMCVCVRLYLELFILGNL